MAAASSIIFITGGVRSGKSRFAEEMATSFGKSSVGQLHYIAAMQPSDDEMKKRIFHHQEDRIQSGYDWRTWEKPVSIGELVPHFKKGDIVLLDCLTTWLNNELFYSEDRWQDERFQADLFEKMTKGISEISQRVKALIIVSNELLNEPIQHDLVYTYSRLLGHLHLYLTANAKQAFLVEAGIAVLMKGEARCGE